MLPPRRDLYWTWLAWCRHSPGRRRRGLSTVECPISPSGWRLGSYKSCAYIIGFMSRGTYSTVHSQVPFPGPAERFARCMYCTYRTASMHGLLQHSDLRRPCAAACVLDAVARESGRAYLRPSCLCPSVGVYACMCVCVYAGESRRAVG